MPEKVTSDNFVSCMTVRSHLIYELSFVYHQPFPFQRYAELIPTLTVINKTRWDFPGSPVSSSLQCGGHGMVPGQGSTIPRTAKQLSPHTTITEHTCSRACVPQLGSPKHQKATFRMPQQRSDKSNT